MAGRPDMVRDKEGVRGDAAVTDRPTAGEGPEFTRMRKIIGRVEALQYVYVNSIPFQITERI